MDPGIAQTSTDLEPLSHCHLSLCPHSTLVSYLEQTGEGWGPGVMV